MSNGLGLLVLDTQEDFLSHPNLTPNKHELVHSISTVLAWARTQHIPVFHVHTIVAQDGSNAMPHWQAGTQFKCQIGSAGASTPSILKPLPQELVFDKQFFNAFDNPKLIEALDLAGIQTLIITGLHTHACVREAVLGAYASGMKVVIPKDAVGSYDPAHAAHTLGWLDGRAAICMSSEKLMQENWQSPPSTDLKTSAWCHRDPSNTENILFEVLPKTRSQIEVIAQSVSLAQVAWGKMPAIERSLRLQHWLAVLKEREKLWVQTLIEDLGKPLIDAQSEVTYGLNLLENICLNLKDLEASNQQVICYRPHGVVALITPWNNPFAIPISKIGPALGFGNGVLWKPALPASHLSGLIYDSLKEVGLDHLVGLITGGASAGQHLITSQHTAAISFTGSLSTGRKVAKTATHLGKPLQAELGGNNAAIVLRDTDLELVAQDLATAMFSFAGQRCTAIRRVIVQSEIADAFTQIFKKAVESLRVGDPSDPSTQVGPIISSDHQQFLLGHIEREKSQGTKILTAAKLPEKLSLQGNWLMPTVFINPNTDSSIWTDELFGPVVALQECHDLDSAIALHNSVEQGLLGVLYSDDQNHQAQFMAQAQAGQLSINQARPNFNVNGPFLGWKQSGIGVPEHGRWNRDFYTKPQITYRTLP